MQIVASTIHYFILAMILMAPFSAPFLLKRKSLLLCGLISLYVCALLVSMFAYWPHLYADLRLGYLGFDSDGWSDNDKVRNVPPEFQDEAIKLYRSTMGVGWPLQALVVMALLVPYQAIASGLVFLVRKAGSHAQIT
jgi:hypothetical protein